jgi:hypothetical protein
MHACVHFWELDHRKLVTDQRLASSSSLLHRWPVVCGAEHITDHIMVSSHVLQLSNAIRLLLPLCISSPSKKGGSWLKELLLHSKVLPLSWTKPLKASKTSRSPIPCSYLQECLLNDLWNVLLTIDDISCMYDWFILPVTISSDHHDGKFGNETTIGVLPLTKKSAVVDCTSIPTISSVSCIALLRHYGCTILQSSFSRIADRYQSIITKVEDASSFLKSLVLGQSMNPLKRSTFGTLSSSPYLCRLSFILIACCHRIEIK